MVQNTWNSFRLCEGMGMETNHKGQFMGDEQRFLQQELPKLFNVHQQQDLERFGSDMITDDVIRMIGKYMNDKHVYRWNYALEFIVGYDLYMSCKTRAPDLWAGGVTKAVLWRMSDGIAETYPGKHTEEEAVGFVLLYDGPFIS